MRKILTFITLVLALTMTAQAQDDSAWKKGGIFNLTFSNTSFGQYWQGGGINTIVIGGLANTYADYEKGKFQWKSTLDLAFGQSKLGKANFLKSDDKIDLNSKIGHKLSDKLLASLMFGFRTQFTDGFDYSAKTATGQPTRISDMFSPAYINLGLGVDYQPNENLSIAYAPLNMKMTLVGDASLRELYLPAEFQDKASRSELGSNLAIKYRKEIAENITYQTSANFFSNYLDNFGNVDVNWDQLFTFKINKFFNASFATSLIYDDDIKFKMVDANNNLLGTGPRTQFRHNFTLGFVYNFGDKKE